MFFAKPRLSAAVINCADCPASLISGSLAFVTVYPPPLLFLSIVSIHLLPPSFSLSLRFQTPVCFSVSLSRGGWRRCTPSLLILAPRPPPFVCACFDRPPSPSPVFPISNDGRGWCGAPRNWPANEPFRVKSCTGVA